MSTPINGGDLDPMDQQENPWIQRVREASSLSFPDVYSQNEAGMKVKQVDGINVITFPLIEGGKEMAGDISALVNSAEIANAEYVQVGQGKDGFYYINLGPKQVGLFVSDPTLYAEVNTAIANKKYVFREKVKPEMMTRVMGESVLFVNGDEINERRARVTRMLARTRKVEGEYASVFQSIIGSELGQISEQLEIQGKVTVDADTLAGNISKATIAEALFGQTVDKDQMDAIEQVGESLREYYLLASINRLIGLPKERGAKQILEKNLKESVLRPSIVSTLVQIRDYMVSMDGWVTVDPPKLQGFGELIAEMVPQGITVEHLNEVIEDLNENKDKKARENLYIKDQEGNIKYTFDDLLADEAIMFLAGADTVAASMQNIFKLLVDHQDIQDAFFNGDLSAKELLDTMLHMRPPVFLIQRGSNHDMNLSNGEMLPEGTAVSFPVGIINRKARERSMDYSATFAKGPRVCPGADYADVEQITFLEELKKLNVRITEGPGYNPVLRSTPSAGVYGLNLSMEKRAA